MKRDLRLPLQVGTSSLEGVARSAATLVPGLLFVCFVLVPPILSPWDEAIETYEQIWWLIIILFFVGVLFLVYGRKHLSLALSERPSDIELVPDGLRIVGGPHNGLLLAWKDINPDDVKVVGRHDDDLELLSDDSGKAEDNFWELRVDWRVLASAEDAPELRSLVALCDSIKASAKRVHDQAAGVAAPTGSVTSLHCPNCGAPATPADQPQVQCRFCGGWVAIPEEVRGRIRAVMTRDAKRRESEQLVAKLLKQPGALRTNLAIVFAALPSLAIWPLILAIAAVLYGLCYLRLFNTALLIVAALAVIRGMFNLVRGQLTDRQALRLLTLHFSARAPARAGEPHRCRSCNAPLAEPPGAMLVACVYCGAENVLGLDARQEAKQQSSETISLEETLENRKKEHRRWRFAGLRAIVLLVVAALLVLVSLGPPHELYAKGDSGNLERMTYDPEDEFHPSVSPDGRIVLYDLRVPEEEGDDAIMSCGPNGAFRGTEYTRANADARRPVWMPDGSGFLYEDFVGDYAHLRRTISPARYSPTIQVAHAGYNISMVSVSPDSKRVVYDSEARRNRGYSIYIATVDGRQHNYLGPGVDPAWSPDGSVIAYARTVGNHTQIKLRSPDGSGASKVITAGACDHNEPTWSPDGAYIGFVANCGHTLDSKIWNLFVIRKDGSGLQQLTDGTSDMDMPTWAGNYIYFSSNVAGNFDVWRLTLGGRLYGHGVRPPLSSITAHMASMRPPAAAGNKPYGAIAYDNQSGGWGVSAASVDQKSADQSALGFCIEHGNHCAIVDEFSNTCAAFATGPGMAVGWATAATNPAAKRQAREICLGKTTGSCRIRYSHCYP